MHPLMRDIAVLFVQLVVTIARLFNPGGARAVVAGPDSQSPDPVGVRSADHSVRPIIPSHLSIV